MDRELSLFFLSNFLTGTAFKYLKQNKIDFFIPYAFWTATLLLLKYRFFM